MKIALSTLLILLSFAAFAQPSVQGIVLDGETNTPLPGANVFIASTTYGVSSAADGTFKLPGLKPIHYQLVVSFIGYETQVFDVVPGQPVIYKVYLKPVARTLNEVVVRARKISRAEWLANLRIFKEHFIGQTENARNVKLVNPRVLDLDNYKGILTAFADSALVMENDALGYRVKVLLTTYEYNTRSSALRYEGQMVFELLKPSNKKEEARWATNRLRAYYGSQVHFLRAFYNQTLNEEGFYWILITDAIPGQRRAVLYDTTLSRRSPVFRNKPIEVRTLLNYNCLLDSASTRESPVMNFKGDLQVHYINEAAPKSYQAFTGQTGRYLQVSQIRMLGPALIQSDGQPFPFDGPRYSGYWGWELMADYLPLNYDPEEDLELLGKK